MANLNLTAAAEFADNAAKPFGVNSPEVLPVAVAYRTNVERIISLARMPAGLIGIGSHMQSTWCKACYEVTGQPLIGRDHDKVQDVVAKFGQLAKTDVMIDTTNPFSDNAFVRIEKIGGGGTVHDALSVACEMQVTGSWTQFEIVAKDLWVAAVNGRPKQLGIEIGKAKKKVQDEEDRRDKKWFLPITKLQAYDFNLKSAMGDLLQERYHFDNLRETTEAYEAAFGDDYGIVDLFNDENLTLAHAIRNVIVHRAGEVDDQFVARVKTHPHWSQMRVGQHIALDSPWASTLTDAAVQCSRQLIIQVDKWLVDHPG